MADVKWIKVSTNMFETSRKIKQIELMPEGDTILVIWLKLLLLAGNVNDGGAIYITPEIPYTEEMLANELRRPLTVVRMALSIFERFGMVEITDDILRLSSWEKYQNTDRLAELREYNRLAQQRSRAKKKALPPAEDAVNDKSMTSQRCHDTDIDLDKDKELDLDIEKEEKVSCQQIIDLFNSICKSFPSVRSLSDARRKAIKARLNTYTLDDLKTVFENAEASSFLKGSNDRNWSANFDWLIKDSNIAKVLEGNYADKAKRYGYKEKVPGWMGFQMGEAELEAIQQQLQNDPDVEAEAEQLRQKMQEKYGKGSL